jgi:Na+-transporting NADH:ubiquinone oxidoreductase subunit C
LLKERQLFNELLEQKRNVLLASDLALADEELSSEEIEIRFSPIKKVVINLQNGEEVENVDQNLFYHRDLTIDSITNCQNSVNDESVIQLSCQSLVYELWDSTNKLEIVVLPVSGMGLWSTLYGFVALDSNLVTIRGLTFYEHRETPGLGGEVDNPRWKELWPGRKAFDANGVVKIEVIRGQAGLPEEDPYRVDGLAGATITSRGVTNLLHFWLGENGFGPYLERLRREKDM